MDQTKQKILHGFQIVDLVVLMVQILSVRDGFTFILQQTNVDTDIMEREYLIETILYHLEQHCLKDFQDMQIVTLIKI